MAKDIKLGIDIGSSKIIAILGYYNEDYKWDLVDFERIQSKGVLRGEIVDVNSVVRCLKVVLNSLKARGHEIPKETNICVGGQYTKNYKHVDFIRRNVGTEYTKQILDEINEIAGSPVKNVNEEEYLKILRGICVDKDTMEKDPYDKVGKKFAAHYNTVFGLSSSLNNIKSVLISCDLQLNNLLLKPEAISEAVLLFNEKDEGVALIDIGAGTTSLIVYESGMLQQAAIIPFGGNTITSDISKRFKLSLHEAELLKRKHGNAFAKYAEDEIVSVVLDERQHSINIKELSSVIQSRVEELLDAALYQIQKSECKDKLEAGYVITGGCASLVNIDKLLYAKDSKPVRLGYFDKDKIIGDRMNNLSFTTAIGTLAREENTKRSSSKLSKIWNSLFK
ncbi:MAG: cell division protein FtsA [Marinifilaceae bacterium]